MASKTPEMKENKSFTGNDPESTRKEVVKLRTQMTIMKSSFNASFDNLVNIQALHEKMLNDMLEKGRGTKAETVKMVKDFIENVKKERDEYRKTMEDVFEKMAEMLKTEK